MPDMDWEAWWTALAEYKRKSIYFNEKECDMARESLSAGLDKQREEIIEAEIRKARTAQANELFQHESGATSSHLCDYSFQATGEGDKVTCLRFRAGNVKHEKSTTVYAEANWLKAYYKKDIGFFRDRAAHAKEHLNDEMRGLDDNDPGGNLGAIGWLVDIMAWVKKNDPYFYGAIQGKYHYEPDGDDNAKREG